MSHVQPLTIEDIFIYIVLDEISIWVRDTVAFSWNIGNLAAI